VTAKDYAQHCYAPNYAAKTGFFSAQKIVRKVVRSKTGYFFWLTEARLTAWLTEKRLRKEQVRSDVRSKMMVNSLLVTSEVNSKMRTTNK
jgi:hypothetical protein